MGGRVLRYEPLDYITVCVLCIYIEYRIQYACCSYCIYQDTLIRAWDNSKRDKKVFCFERKNIF